MKTTKNINNLLILILIFFSFSCTEILTQGTRVRVLCDDLSDKETLRAKGMGEASIYTIAERKSAAIARDELGKSVLNSIQSTTDLEFQQIMLLVQSPKHNKPGNRVHEKQNPRIMSEADYHSQCDYISAGT